MTKNWFLFTGEYYIMFVNSTKYGIKEFLISKEDFDRVSEYTWRLFVAKSKYNKVFYATTGSPKCKFGQLLLHRFLTNCPPDKQVDHINRNTFDNRQENMRICTASENLLNRGEVLNYPNKSTGIKGLGYYYISNRKRYMYCVNIRKYKLKFFDNKELALAYIEECKQGLHRR